MPSEDLCHVYEKLNGVPQCIIDTAINTTSQEQLDNLCKAFVGGDRGGPANVRNVCANEGGPANVRNAAPRARNKHDPFSGLSYSAHVNRSYDMELY